MKRTLLFILLAAFMVQSCSKKAITRKYYMLELPIMADSVLTRTALTDGSVEIRPALVPPAFSQYRIAVRERSHEISYYSSHHWAMEPGELVTGLVKQKIKRSNLFPTITESSWRAMPKYQIITRVDQIEAMKIGDDLAAHVAGRFELLYAETKETIVYHEFDHRQILEEKDLNLMAEEQSKILNQEINTFLILVKNHLVKHDALPQNLEIVP
jgi:ABC-type uncharacterized transport system auxiliary subunit